MTGPGGRGQGQKFLRAVAWRRPLARAAILWERIWPGLWPALTFASVLLVAALLDLPSLLPAWLHVAVLAASALALPLLLWHGLRRVLLPARSEGDRRIERASGLAHRPLEILSDRIAAGQGDAQAEHLWRAHLARTAARIRRLRVGLPHPGMAARDPRGLRAALVLCVLAAFVVAGSSADVRLARALSPQFSQPAPPLPTRLDVWIAPPAYTGIAPLFLDAAGGRAEVSVPEGSKLTASLSGGSGVPELRVGDRAVPFQAMEADAWSVETTLEAGSRLAVTRDGREVASWPLIVVPDLPPVVAHAAPPGRQRDSRGIRIEYDASDDFGLTQVQAELRLEARPDAAPIMVELPLPAGSPRQARGVGGGDLTAHPWAGLPVSVRLLARDGKDQEGISEPARLVLPERNFIHPVARAVIGVRRQLSLAPDDRARALSDLDRISREGAAFDDDTSVYLALRVARARLVRDRRPDAVEEVQALLWDIALRLEEGAADQTERAVNTLREEIRRLLDQARRGEQIDKAELDRLMRELAEAVQRHLEALAERMEREGRIDRSDPESRDRTIDERDLSRMMERMREAARQDRMADAQRQLERLERMLDQLRDGRTARQQQENPERQQRRQQGQNAMGALNDMIQRQGSLMDHGNQREQERLADQQRRPNPRDPQAQQQARERDASRDQRSQQGRTQDQRQQQALRRALGEIMQQFGDATGEVPEPLGRADQEMRGAGQALQRGDEAGAQAAQQRAIDALQEGGRQMQQQMARQFGRQQQRGQNQGEQGEQQGEGEGEGEGEADENGFSGGENEGQGRQRAQGRDPLGRSQVDEAGGADEGSDVRVPEEMEQQRSRAIQQELRRRLGERERPQQELDYIDRLLRRF